MEPPGGIPSVVKFEIGRHMANITSKDGTKIAFEKTGSGPAVIIVNGALAHRNLYGDKPLHQC